MRSLGWSAAVLVAAAACGGTTKTTTTGEGSGSGSAEKSAPGTDLTIDLDAVPLKGIVFTPEALGRPPMLLVEEKKKTPLDKERTAYQKAPDLETRKVAGQVLATSLYQESKKEKDATKEKALRDEARKTLTEVRDAANAAGGAGEITLRMLAVLDMIDADYTAAADVYAELLKRFPTSDKALDDKTWLTLCQLRLGKNADALATVKDVQPDKDHPELAYVTAWAKWRGGDQAGAVAGITAAAQGWKGEATRQAMTRDLLVILARADAPPDAAFKTVSDYAGGKQLVPMLFNLHNSYAFAGRWAEASAVLDQMMSTLGDQIAKNDVPKFRSLQAQYAVRLLAGDQVASFEKKAVDAYAACGDKCKPEELDDGYKALGRLATTFHTIYVTAQDDRFYQPAKDLYALYNALPGRPDAADMKKHAEDLEQSKKFDEDAKKAGKPAKGTHDKQIVAALIGGHVQEVQACFEETLAAEPTTSGTLTLTLEVDQTGKVTGATSDPPAGKQGLARVGQCATAAARTWLLPARTIPGKTRVTAKYELQPATAAK